MKEHTTIDNHMCSLNPMRRDPSQGLAWLAWLPFEADGAVAWSKSETAHMRGPLLASYQDVPACRPTSRFTVRYHIH
jgi:hypothetical protein